MRPVRHYEFISALQEQARIVGAQRLRIGIRIDGNATDANIALVSVGRGRDEWRVGPNGGRIRSDHWNMYEWVKQALSFRRPDDVYAVFEHGINFMKQGWVVLVVERGEVTLASWRARF